MEERYLVGENAVENLKKGITMTTLQKQDSSLVVKKKLTIAQQRERDAEMVTGRFTFTECPGGILGFRYRKYKGDQIEPHYLMDGSICTIPRGVAKHLATNGSYPVHEHATDENGKSILRVSHMKKRYNFESLEFFDESELESSL